MEVDPLLADSTSSFISSAEKETPSSHSFLHQIVQSLLKLHEQYNDTYQDEMFKRPRYEYNLSKLVLIAENTGTSVEELWKLSGDFVCPLTRRRIRKKLITCLAARNQLEAIEFVRYGKKKKEKDLMLYRLVKSFAQTHLSTAHFFAEEISSSFRREKAYLWIANGEAKQSPEKAINTITEKVSRVNLIFLSCLKVAKVRVKTNPKEIDDAFAYPKFALTHLSKKKKIWGVAKIIKAIAEVNLLKAKKYFKTLNIRKYVGKSRILEDMAKSRILKAMAIGSRSLKIIKQIEWQGDQYQAFVTIGCLVGRENLCFAKKCFKEATKFTRKKMNASWKNMTIEKWAPTWAQIDPHSALGEIKGIMSKSRRNEMLFTFFEFAHEPSLREEAFKLLSDTELCTYAILINEAEKHKNILKIEESTGEMEPLKKMSEMTIILDALWTRTQEKKNVS